MSIKRRAAFAALAFVFVCTVALGTGSVFAARSDELQERLDELQERAGENDALQQQVQDRLDANYTQISDMVRRKQELDQTISDTQQQLQALNVQIETYNLSIADKQAEVEQGEIAQSELQEKYKQRIRAMEETGSISYWSVLFESRSFSDLLDRLDMIQEIMAADQLMLEQVQTLSQQLVDERAALEEEKQQLLAAKEELAALELQLEAQRAESDSYILQINSDIGLLNALRMEYEQLGDELQEQIDSVQTQYDAAKAEEEAARRRQQEAQNAAGSSTVTDGSSSGVSASGFLFPLPAGAGTFITDPYGYRYHPIDGIYKMHSGVDFAVAQGTSVYASKSGVVTVASYNDINGNYIKLQHPDGSMTYYLHLDTFAVSAGDSVVQGQKIGTVGSTGNSTGPHLHFQIMINGAAVNPMDYVSLQ